jgi:hypothetical protein
MVRAYFGAAVLLTQFVCSRPAVAGPYANVGVPSGDSAIALWATKLINYGPAPGVNPGVSDPAHAFGPANGAIVSLGDLTGPQIDAGTPPGRITLSFDLPIMNGPGWDLLVFENAAALFSPPFVFGELAYVEVSSNGVDFARFPSVSLNVEPGQGVPGDTEIDASFGRAFAGINTTNVYNLAGIHPSRVGTPFELDELAADPLVQSGLLDLDNVQWVRVVDIPGNGSFKDATGRGILDAWPTTGTGGFDLDAVGARYAVPEPASALLAGGGCILFLSIASLKGRMSRLCKAKPC